MENTNINTSINTSEITIATHSGSFHPDDVFAVATLMLVFEKEKKINVIRTRDEDLINQADFVVDVGSIYDREKNRFDHHQLGGAGGRLNGIPYASFGLVWQKYGEEVAGSKEVADEIDRVLVSPIDARDNGIELEKEIGDFGIKTYSIHNMIWNFRTTWKEDESLLQENFIYLTGISKKIIEREAKHIKDRIKSEKIIDTIYNNNKDKRLLIIDKHYPYDRYVSSKQDILLVIYPKLVDGTWGIENARDDFMSYKGRFYFPEDWRGKSGKELEDITGIKDVVFCHRGGFIFVAKTKEACIEVVKKVIPDINV